VRRIVLPSGDAGDHATDDNRAIVPRGHERVLDRTGVPRAAVRPRLLAQGSGKTTLLRCVNHLEVPSAGHVVLDGELIGQYTQRGRMVPPPPRASSRRSARRSAWCSSTSTCSGHKTPPEPVIEAPRQVKGVGRDGDVADRVVFMDDGVVVEQGLRPARTPRS
jgi:ABC-type polar amino acid transport system ATPase subunit